MIKVIFIKDFATRKKGDVVEYDPMLVNTLINKKVAKRYVKPKKEVKK